MEAFHGAYGGDAFEGQSIGGYVGRDAVAPGDGDDAAQGLFDAHDPPSGPPLVVAFQFVGDVYEATGVYEVVWGV